MQMLLILAHGIYRVKCYYLVEETALHAGERVGSAGLRTRMGGRRTKTMAAFFLFQGRLIYSETRRLRLD